MKRKVVNPNPQQKKMQKLEEKLYDEDMKEDILASAEIEENEEIENEENISK